MKLLLDQGLPRSTARILRERAVPTDHVGELGLAQATDEAIIAHARNGGYTVVTLDSDFHAVLALTQATGPSAIRIRMQRLRAIDAAEVISLVLDRVGHALDSGIVVTVTSGAIRVRHLPIRRGV